MNRITIFSGNRAEFGILFPIIQNLSEDFEVDLILSGAHVLKKWNTREDIKKQIRKYNIKCNIVEIELVDEEDTYIHCLGEIYGRVISYYEDRKNISLAIVLGDRIESFAFALASFYSQIPLIHLCGGDVVNVPNYDTNVRHSISKIANYHFVTSEQSKSILLQIGEETKRVFNIGNPSFDYDRLGLLPTISELEQKYSISTQDMIAIFTFHPASMKTAEENYNEFKCSLDAVVDSMVDKVIVTYPNNDPGYNLILDYIENLNRNSRILCIKSLGTNNYLALMKYFKSIIVGNSSSGLLETPLYCTPVINIGERQSERIRGCNVKDVKIDYNNIKFSVNEVVKKYNVLKTEYQKTQYIFGDGTAAIKAHQCIEQILKERKEDRLFKKFVIR
ncbi:UDP-N-acetylglucosamine 2-epimerase (hydrolyzing) [Roseburia hominis]|uniref:UDP-N-acetylglucosamine 2-epimerase n=1 Tax=Roseburia hominis TaxID=301301 RepID=UPI001F2ABC27|nr:UDP-N-acetylglucosamine 2-epimerase (hydrolyzing) [Roseburia hominis]